MSLAWFRRFVTGEGTRWALRWCTEPWREATNTIARENPLLTDVLSVSFLGISLIFALSFGETGVRVRLMSINTADINSIEPRSAASTHRVGPYSRPHALARLDKRTREARFLKRVRDELTAYLGGSEHMTAPQRILVERVAVDLLRLETLDQKIARGEQLTDHDGRIAHAIRNSIRLMLRDLDGPQQATAPGSALIAAMIADHQVDRP